ncbi:hypothetical protein DB31_1393 [Hyalangium minutum]|uniref:Uncharacterized protein n=1 Tax=Hyalangium minutum TaxID=394096 RepID=A0A085WC64_9BACT|nr:hypothetical protein DB31_1393 [Hyalangium minutum]
MNAQASTGFARQGGQLPGLRGNTSPSFYGVATSEELSDKFKANTATGP